jgi:pimeloyl-ACP methyl ester carboxylesterase
MRRRAQTRALTALLVLALTALTASSARASSGLAFGACAEASSFSCAALAVPLDRTGALPGTLQLAVERRLSGAKQSTDAVLALAGGPGQATLPLREFIAKAMAPALASRDLLLFDQRGTGSSGALRCPAFEEPGLSSPAAMWERCARELGPARGAFTSAESVEDIEALRRAAGYEKLVLYATSYGTKVALEYAARYPQHVESMVLDSVVPAAGKEPFQVASFEAIRPALEELCSAGACAGISGNPVGDVARLAARLRRHALHGFVFDGSGHRHALALAEPELLDVLRAGDLNPALRALLPAAVRSALAGDPDPLLRLWLLAFGLIPETPEVPGGEATPQLDDAVLAATSCEETPFPWQRGASSTTRLAEAAAALRALPEGDFYPFDRSTALDGSLIPECSRWPDASPAPAPPGPLPDVPTLLLSGAQDLRTPTSQARAVAAMIPGAHVLVVPYTGHSVLGSDLSGCAGRGLAAFFAGASVQPCGPGANMFAPTPVTPERLSAVRPPSGLAGRPGRTLVAALDAIIDLDRQLIGATIQADRELPSGSSFGGLRGGYARLTHSALVLRRFSLVPGVALTGSFPIRSGQIQAGTISVSGSQAAPGSVRVGTGFKRASGTLGGRRFSLAVPRARLARVDAGDWPTLAVLAPLLAARRDGTGALAGAHAWLR